jgi:Fe-S-cluster containining protein
MDAFRFTCVPGCTDCCHQKGYVYLTEEDLRRAAEFLRMSPAEFEKKYVYRTKTLLRLRKPRGSQCHFLRQEGCSIHPAKPTQCRAFPFWPEMVASREAWGQTASYCPGIGNGPLVTIEAACGIAAEMRESYPGIYGATRRPHRPPAGS